MKFLTGSIVAAMSLALGASSGSAAILVYDGNYGDGWSQQQWDMTTNSDFYYGSTGPSLATAKIGGGATSVGVQHPGLMVGNNYVLSFYINTIDDNPSGTLLVRIRFDGYDAAHQFNERNIPAVYNIDGVDYDYPVTTDADSGTWQHVTVDLTQTRYPGWPYVPTTWDPATQALTYISILAGADNVVIDDITLVPVPQPGALALIGLAGAGILRRRRS